MNEQELDNVVEEAWASLTNEQKLALLDKATVKLLAKEELEKLRFSSAWSEGYYYIFGPGQGPIKRVFAWLLLPIALLSMIIGVCITGTEERLIDPRKLKENK